MFYYKTSIPDRINIDRTISILRDTMVMNFSNLSTRPEFSILHYQLSIKIWGCKGFDGDFEPW